MSFPLFAAIAAIAVLYLVSLLRWPLRPCPKCKGKGVNRGSSGKRYGRCGKCKGTKQAKRIGATAVHRFWWSVAGAASRRRLDKKVARAQEKGRYPES